MKEKIINIVEELKKELGLENVEVNVEIKEFKRKVASVSLNNNTIRINKEVLEDEVFLRKILLHELLHIKLNTKWHTPEFLEI